MIIFKKIKKKIYQRIKNKPIDKNIRDNYYMKSRYGITKKEYEQMLKERKYCCDICGYVQPINAIKREKLYIDHCHITKKVRGLLCFSCNTAIGHFKENIETINNAIKYLEKWKEN